MTPLARSGGVLHCGPFALDDIAARFGTPLYLYDGALLEQRFRTFKAAFPGARLLVAYSVKANGSLALLNRLARLGSGADIVSGGELARALEAGIPAERIVFAGAGKSEEELDAGLDAGIYGFNVESREELRLLERIAARRGVRARIALRVNLDIASPTPHEYTRTGHAGTKFGIPVGEVMDLYRRAASRAALQVAGIAVHIGSQIVDIEPYQRAARGLLALERALSDEGIPLEYVDLGGGFGVAYGDEPEIDLARLAAAVLPAVIERRLRLILEPGRFIVGEAGTLIVRVLYLKRSGNKTFVITDGGMTELLRPSHYGGYHQIEPVRTRPGAAVVVSDVVGPVCEDGDFLARDRAIELPSAGDLMVVRTAGAYGFAMASNYNSRLRPAEVLVADGGLHLIRERETFADLVRGERIPS
ncbi:MAG: diaminopimelate decarboxylase [Gammaproteobacteria bacterium]|nr:diaminopimelate decarboxylase [Gammaproteobacteria bacterium]